METEAEWKGSPGLYRRLRRRLVGRRQRGPGGDGGEESPDSILLWGKRDGTGGYREGRIPRRITEYPEIAGAQRLGVRIKAYKLSERTPWHEGGKIVERETSVFLFRCCAIELVR